MKRLVLAMCCLAMGAGVFAAESKNTLPAGKKTAVEVTVNKKDLKKNNFRIQKMFQVYDPCGQLINVWVSAPNGTDWNVMYDCALDYVIGCLNSNGCYQ
jgi:hypothetical protein